MVTKQAAVRSPSPKPAPRKPRARVTVHPLTPKRWPDFEAVVGPKGAYGGCWCMYFRRPRAEWTAGCADSGAGNKRAFKKIVRVGAEPGLLAYVSGVPAGWCALAPRGEYGGLARSRTLQPIDDQPVWSVTCFFVARPYRKQGVTIALLEGAAKYVRKQKGRILEGYPSDPKARWPDAYAYQGTVGAYAKAGFVEVKRVSKGRAIMRRVLR
ncbi:MAG: GNAT family N-acetyltransferase [Candidatus Eisenbacteria bacterium]